MKNKCTRETFKGMAVFNTLFSLFIFKMISDDMPEDIFMAKKI
jgi:hypothetical protein